MLLSGLLTAIFGFMAFYSVLFVQRKIFRYTLLLFYGFTIYFIWHPEATTTIAQSVGMGRGLDLIFVLFSVAIINGGLFGIKHVSAQHKKVTQLIRHGAIQEAIKPNEALRKAKGSKNGKVS